MTTHFRELAVEELRASVDPNAFPFDHTGVLTPLEEGVVGQERAIDAIKFGMGMKEKGYNIFIAGPAKAGLTYIARTFLEEQAKKEPTPPRLVLRLQLQAARRTQEPSAVSRTRQGIEEGHGILHSNPAGQDP